MKLNDSITTYDIAEALQGEQGKFEVTSPIGERYFVTCQPGHSITSIEWVGNEAVSALPGAQGSATCDDLGGTQQEIRGR